MNNILYRLPVELVPVITYRYSLKLKQHGLLQFLLNNIRHEYDLGTDNAWNFFVSVHCLLCRKEGRLPRRIIYPDFVDVREYYREIDENVFLLDILADYIMYNIELYKDIMNHKEYEWIKTSIPETLKHTSDSIEYTMRDGIKSIMSTINLLAYRKHVPGAVFFGKTLFLLSSRGAKVYTVSESSPDTTLDNLISEKQYDLAVQLKPKVVDTLIRRPVYEAVQMLHYIEKRLRNDITYSTIIGTGTIVRRIQLSGEFIEIRYSPKNSLDIGIFPLDAEEYVVSLKPNAKKDEVRDVLMSIRNEVLHEIEVPDPFNAEELILSTYWVKRLMLNLGIPYEYLVPLLPLVIDEKPVKKKDYILYTIYSGYSRKTIEIVSTNKGFGWLVLDNDNRVLNIPTPAVALLRFYDILKERFSYNNVLLKAVNFIINNMRIQNLKTSELNFEAPEISFLTPSDKLVKVTTTNAYRGTLADELTLSDNLCRVWIVNIRNGKARRVRKSVTLRDNSYVVVYKSNIFGMNTYRIIPLHILLKRNMESTILFNNYSGKPLVQIGNIIIYSE
ncbi:MAG: hypothetical protein GXO26_08755 [Crenarchaeota archaeon]|nr:hypothetical protein [Thermoproteota archaeon]